MHRCRSNWGELASQRTTAVRTLTETRSSAMPYVQTGSSAATSHRRCCLLVTNGDTAVGRARDKCAREGGDSCSHCASTTGNFATMTNSSGNGRSRLLHVVSPPTPPRENVHTRIHTHTLYTLAIRRGHKRRRRHLRRVVGLKHPRNTANVVADALERQLDVLLQQRRKCSHGAGSGRR